MCVTVSVFAQVYLPPPPWDCPHQGQTLQHQMNIRWVFQSPLSLLLLPLGATSLESHSPSSAFTHHEEKIQNMWCTSLIPFLPHATTTSELDLYYHLSNTDIWQCHQEETLYHKSRNEMRNYCCCNIVGDIFELWAKWAIKSETFWKIDYILLVKILSVINTEINHFDQLCTFPATAIAGK